MSFDLSESAGRWWASPRGNTPQLQALLRHRSNSNIVALAAVVKIAREVAPEEAESANLIATVDLLKGIPAVTMSRLARHPSFNYWVWATSHLLRAKSGLEKYQGGLAIDASSTDALALHLRDLQRFSVAAHLMAGKELDWVTLTPVHSGPLVFPGTGIAIEGFKPGLPIDVYFTHGIAEMVQVQDQASWIAIKVDAPHDAMGGPHRLLPVPRVFAATGPAFEIDVWDPYFRHGWVRHEVFPDGNRAPMAQEGELEQWSRTLHSAMELLAGAQPELAAEIACVVQSVVPITSPDKMKNLSVSAPEFWGAIQCTLDPAPMMGEVLVHEYRHNLLHSLNALDPIFTPDSPGGERFYSPWRDDPRPLNGLLHAMFTFLGVVTYYRGLLQSAELTPQNRRAARRRAAAHTLRLQLSVEQFKLATLTPFGRGLFSGILSGIEEAAEFAKELRGPDTLDAIEAVEKHARSQNASLSI